MAKATDTSPYVGHTCRICGKLIKLSASDGWYVWDPEKRKVVQAAHISCRFPTRKDS